MKVKGRGFQAVFLLAVTVLAFLTIPAPAHAGSMQNWELVYINNPDGSAAYGNINDLVEAIDAGAEVAIITRGVTVTRISLEQVSYWETSPGNYLVFGRAWEYAVDFGGNGMPQHVDYTKALKMLRSDGVFENTLYNTVEDTITAKWTVQSSFEWYINR